MRERIHSCRSERQVSIYTPTAMLHIVNVNTVKYIKAILLFEDM